MQEADAIDRIRNLAVEAEGKVVEVDGRPYTERSLHGVKDPEPDELSIYTLTGLVDYLEHNLDALTPNETMIHVVGPARVNVRGPLSDPWLQRAAYAAARFTRTPFPFGEYLGTDELNTRLQAEFTPGGDRADVLRLVGTIKDEQVRTKQDDGVTQKVTASAGVVLSDEVNVPNPVELRPYRTFTEVDQPGSPFVLRVRKGMQGAIEAGLFEADGGAWKNEAVERIAEWLGERLSNYLIIA